MIEDDCIPFAKLPGTSALLRAFLERDAAVSRWYPVDAGSAVEFDETHRATLADLLSAQAVQFDLDASAAASIEKLRAGAAAVVTGQQVGLFGGPLLTLMKAATAVRKAADATKATGREHVPVFWLASEDHDLAEVDQAAFPAKTQVETVSLGLKTKAPVPVGAIRVDAEASRLQAALDEVSALLGYAPVCDWLRECYTPGATLADAFGRLLGKVFAGHGLIVMDAASRGFHALGKRALRSAIENASELEAALLKRSRELEAAGFHAQVLVSPGHSLLFLIDEESGARLPLLRNQDGAWRAGARSFTTSELLAVLDEAPERLSPNALLRPVFQDCILPTAAYIGGPAEVAYFAQAAVVFERVLGCVTPVLLRMSATLIEPAVTRVMQKDEVTLLQVIEAKTAEELALRLGARAMPIEGKRKIAAAGNAMDTELAALTDYMRGMSAELGRAADVSASKMRYQMNRLRRMAARFETQSEESLSKHAVAMMLQLYPNGHLQERLLNSSWALAKFGEGLAGLLIEHAGDECEGHSVLTL